MQVSPELWAKSRCLRPQCRTARRNAFLRGLGFAARTWMAVPDAAAVPWARNGGAASARRSGAAPQSCARDRSPGPVECRGCFLCEGTHAAEPAPPRPPPAPHAPLLLHSTPSSCRRCRGTRRSKHGPLMMPNTRLMITDGGLAAADVAARFRWRHAAFLAKTTEKHQHGTHGR